MHYIMKINFKKYLLWWWQGIKYSPSDPKYKDVINIVAIGGGSGLANLLSGLKDHAQKITAIVTVADSGKSSGKIKNEFNVLPPGDIRKCLAALSPNQDLKEIFELRLKGVRDGQLSGHAFGNIWLLALSQHFGSFEKAIEESSHLLEISGHVYPSTLDKIDLVCRFNNGQKVMGEHEIASVNESIDRISLTKKARGYTKAIKAIEEADYIIIGPGSLYTSIIPNFLIPGIRKAILENNRALKIFVCNASTERGETERMTVADHVKAFVDHVGKVFDCILINNKILKQSSNTHKLGEINNITSSDKEILGIPTVYKDLINENNPLYHDNIKLAKALMQCYNKYRK